MQKGGLGKYLLYLPYLILIVSAVISASPYVQASFELGLEENDQSRLNNISRDPDTLDPTFVLTIVPSATSDTIPTRTPTPSQTLTPSPSLTPSVTYTPFPLGPTHSPEPPGTPASFLTQTPLPIATVPIPTLTPSQTPTQTPTPSATPNLSTATPVPSRKFNTYLPFIFDPPTVGSPIAVINFLCDGSFNFIEIESSQIVLQDNPRQMGIIAEVAGYQDSLYTTEWVINGFSQPQLINFGIIESGDALLESTMIALTSGSGCSEAFPPGTYQVNFYIDGKLMLSPSIVVN